MFGGILKRGDIVVIAVVERAYWDGGWSMVQLLRKPQGGFVADVPALLDRATIAPGVTL